MPEAKRRLSTRGAASPSEAPHVQPSNGSDWATTASWGGTKTPSCSKSRCGRAETTNQNKPNTNLTKPTNTVNNIRPADAPRASTGTVTGVTGTPASGFHPPAAPSMKSVDTTKVPLPQTSKGTK
jgi:hypothetical protein